MLEMFFELTSAKAFPDLFTYDFGKKWREICVLKRGQNR